MDVQRQPQEVVCQVLTQLEARAGVRVLYAAYSGSRVRGYAGRDSDTDVRLLYLRRPAWYLELPGRRRPDTLDRHSSPLVAQLETWAASQGEAEWDVVGWDMGKALGQLGNSNAMLLEWLGVEAAEVLVRRPSLEPLYALRAQFYSPRACVYYYLGMAKRCQTEAGAGADVALKPYVTMLYSLLVGQWVAQHEAEVLTAVPLAELLADPALRVPRAVQRGVTRLVMQRGEGVQRVARDALVDKWARKLDAGLVQRLPQVSTGQAGTNEQAVLNELFVALLRQEWGLRWGKRSNAPGAVR